MANKTFTFPDGGNLYVDYSGSGNNTVTFTADENTGDDRELTLTFRTASNNVQLLKKVIQKSNSSYTFDLSAITSSNANVGVQLGWQYSNGTSVAQPFNLNGEEYNATVTNYWTNDTTNHVYNVTAQKEVGNEYVFYANTINNTANITSATINSTLPAVNLAYCFNNCRNLTSIDSWTLNVVNMAYALQNCSNLASIDGVAKWNVTNMTNMANGFRYCTKITTLDGLANWDTSNVTSLHYTFFNCSNLTSLDGVANWDVSNVTAMNYTFCNCYNITNHGINSWTGASANCSYMFRSCNKLDDIEIHFNITCAANMFSNRNTPLNVYASTSTNAYNAIYRAMGNSTTNSSWNVTLYELEE